MVNQIKTNDQNTIATKIDEMDSGTDRSSVGADFVIQGLKLEKTFSSSKELDHDKKLDKGKVKGSGDLANLLE